MGGTAAPRRGAHRSTHRAGQRVTDLTPHTGEHDDPLADIDWSLKRLTHEWAGPRIFPSEGKLPVIMMKSDASGGGDEEHKVRERDAHGDEQEDEGIVGAAQ